MSFNKCLVILINIIVHKRDGATCSRNFDGYYYDCDCLSCFQSTLDTCVYSMVGGI